MPAIQINKFEVLSELKKYKKNLIIADKYSVEVILADFNAYIHNNQLLLDRYDFCTHKFSSEIAFKTGIKPFYALWDYVQTLSKKYDATSIFSAQEYQKTKKENNNVLLFTCHILSFLPTDMIKTYMEDFLFDRENIVLFDLGINFIYDAIILDYFKKKATGCEIGKLCNLVEEKNNILQCYIDYAVFKTASMSSNYMYRNELNFDFVRIASLCIVNDLINYMQEIQNSSSVEEEEEEHKPSKISYKLTYEQLPIKSFYINKNRLKLTPLQTKLLFAIVEEQGLHEFNSVKQRVHEINAKAAEIIKNDDIKFITKEDAYSDYRINNLIYDISSCFLNCIS